MLKTFNCGIGMVAIVAPEAAEDARTAFAQAGHAVFDIGQVTPTPGMVFTGQLS